MNPLQVVIVNDFAHINGGAAKVALLSAIGLAERGHDVSVLSAVGPTMPELGRAGVKIVCTDQEQILTDLNRVRAARQGIWNKKASRAITELLEQCDPARTVVHFHGWTKALSSSVIRAAADRSFPMVFTLHEYFAACPNGGFFNYQTNTVCGLRGMSADCILTNCDKQGYGHKLWRVGRQVVQHRYGRVPEGFGHAIAISQFSRDILAHYLPGTVRLHNVPNPIAVSKQEPVNCKANNSFVVVGRLGREKGVLLFAEAAKMTGVPAQFIGDGECRAELEEKYPEASIIGWCDELQVRTYLAQARALVLPSLWYETYGLVVLEAAAMGIPAIVPDNNAASENVVDGLTGLWFRSGDVDDLAAKLERLQDKDYARKLGQTAYERFWADPPTMTRHLDRLEHVYRLIMGHESESGADICEAPDREVERI